ncbi:MAG: uracil-DNA glycosylase [Alphaproteobacteria bacterium]|nr:uracil-DNA glycosylase [Alphaproteobacteria bacterium]
MWGKEPASAADVANVLQWWSDAGVDCLVDEPPHDWLRTKPKPSAATDMAARNVIAEPGASLPDQLDLFRAFLAGSDTLPFASPGVQRVCPSGDPASGLMLLTDMPAAEDCGSGVLLSGEAGGLFDRMLAAIGRSRETVYLAAFSCLRSPSGAFNEDGATRCATLARHHIGLAAPKALLLLGDTCSKALLGMPMMQARGRWHQLSTHAGDIAVMASFAPSYLLDQPTAKRHAWADLQMLMDKLDQ